MLTEKVATTARGGGPEGRRGRTSNLSLSFLHSLMKVTNKPELTN